MSLVYQEFTVHNMNYCLLLVYYNKGEFKKVERM